jgi:uncharacterized protein (DUF2235 family)
MSEQKPKLASYKRIILCSDGTWLASDLGDKSVPSNVAKIARAIANSGPDADGNLVKQIVLYHSGLGSGDLPFQKAIYGECSARICLFAFPRTSFLLMCCFTHRRHRLGSR